MEAAPTLNDDLFLAICFTLSFADEFSSSGQTKPLQFFIRPSNICDHPFERTDWKAVA
jgi:hypothetical protein